MFLIGLWGYRYMVSVGHVLEAPGKPVELQYVSDVGKVGRLRAESYALDISGGTVRLNQVSFSDGTGQILANLKKVDVTNLNALYGADQTIHVRGVDLKARLVRLADGRLELQDFLPKSTDEKSTIPFEVSLENVRVEVIDQKGTPFRTTVSTSKVDVAGLGDDWIAHTVASVNGIGTIDAAIQRSSNVGIDVLTNSREIQLAGLINHLTSTGDLNEIPDVRTASVRSAIVRGPGRVFLPTNQGLRAESSLIAEIQDLRYQNYQFANLNFNGLVSEIGAIGKLGYVDGATRAQGEGSIRWDKTQRMGGHVVVRSPNPRSLPAWIRTYIPKDVAYRSGTFTGWVSYDAKDQAKITGEFLASEAVFQDQKIENLKGRVAYAGDEVRAKLDSATYRGQPASGIVAYNLKSKELDGALDKINLNLADLKSFGVKGLSGAAIVTTILGGTSDQPLVAFAGSGTGKFDRGDHRVNLGEFNASGIYRDGSIFLDRAIVQSPAGLVVANAALDPKGNLTGKVLGRGVRTTVVDPKVGGRANLEATLSGTLKNPIAKGRVEAYAIRFQDESFPVAEANFEANLDGLNLESFQAVRGSAVVSGSGKVDFKSQRLFADVKGENIQLADLLGPDYGGAVQIPSLEISGTVGKPAIDGIIRGENLVVHGVKVDMLSGRAFGAGDNFNFADAFATVGKGTLKANGAFALSTKSGTLSLTASNLELEELLPEFSGYVTGSGMVAGDVNLSFKDGQLSSANGQGNLNRVAVNGKLVGSGPWTVDSLGSKISGTLEIGQLESFLTLQAFSFDTDSKAITGKLDMFNLRLGDLVDIAGRYLPSDLGFEARQTIDSLSGKVSMGAQVSGTAEHPIVDIPSLSIEDLKVKDETFASLDASFKRDDGNWDIRNIALLGDPNKISEVGKTGQARYAVHGKLEEQGNLDLSADFTNIGLSDLSGLVPWFTGKSGQATAFFNATGKTSLPEIRGTFQANGLLAELDKGLLKQVAGEEAATGGLTEEQLTRYYDKTLTVNLSDIRVSQGSGDDAGIRLFGDYAYSGFLGTLSANLPFAYPFTIPGDLPASGKVTLAERNLTPIAELVEALDPKRTDGTIAGNIVATGTPANLTVGGSIVTQAKSFALDVMDDPVKNLLAQISLEPHQLVLSAQADSSRGGSIKAEATTPVADLENLTESFQNGFLTNFLNSPVKGSVAINNLALRQTLPGKGLLAGEVSGNLTVDGMLSAPSIKGEAKLAKGEMQIPTLEPGTNQRDPLKVNPTFDITASLTDPVHIKSSGAELYLLGRGSLRGSLEYPNVNASMFVDHGSIRLPGGAVRLDQGGTAVLRYSSTSLDTRSSLAVEMEGRTAVTAPVYADQLERYEVLIGIRGDLLTPDGLVLSATSDPPGLSQDRILALLGQTDLIGSIGSGLVGGGVGGDTTKRLQGALLGYALPVFLDPVTSGLAQGLGLDYLTLEYNAYAEATVVLSKPLGSGFSFQGRRQLTAPPPGFVSPYEVKLVYRPRRLPGVLNRISFSIGADELRPWKLAIEYGTRF